MAEKFKQAMRKSQRRIEYAKAPAVKVDDKEAIVEAVHRKRVKKLLFGENIGDWLPKTELGKKVKAGEIGRAHV